MNNNIKFIYRFPFEDNRVAHSKRSVTDTVPFGGGPRTDNPSGISVKVGPEVVGGCPVQQLVRRQGGWKQRRRRRRGCLCKNKIGGRERKRAHTKKIIRTWEMATRDRDNIFMGSTNTSDQRSISFLSESDQSHKIYKFL